MKSIQSKLLVLVISVLMILALAIGIISMGTTNSILHENAEVILSSICQKEAETLNKTLESIRYSVQIMENHALSQLESVDALRDEAYYEAYTKSMEDLFAIIADNTEGVVAYYLRYNAEITSPTSGFFYSRQEGTDRIVKLPSTDISQYSPTDIEHVGWYYEPIKAGHAIWMEPYHNKNNGITMISYVIPLYRNNTLIGVVGMDVDFSVLTTSANKIVVYENGRAYLVGPDQQVIYGANGAKTDILDADKGNYVESMTVLENGMGLMIRADYSDIQKDSQMMMLVIFWVVIAVLAFAILVTVLETRRIVLPLKKLTVAAQDLASGKMVEHLDYDANDEVGMLSRVFQKTSEKLQTYMSYINALAYRDSLTGVKNRTAYIEKIEALENSMNCDNPHFAVLVADINNLKLANDRYGHDIGNELIVSTAKILTDVFSHSSVFRIGGDEFVVILENRDLDDYRALLDKLDDLCQKTVISVGNETVAVSLARGVAVYNPKIDCVFDDVFNHADHAMYLHKDAMKSKKS